MPVASANKVPRPRGGTNNTGEGASGKRIIDVERPPASQFGKKMALTFNWLQDEGVPMAKAIAKLRSIYDEALKEGKKGVDEFFLYTSFFLQLPISSGTVKEKVGKADEKTLETICKFGVSFFQEEQERIRKQKEANPANEASDDSDGMLNESVLIELPYFLRKLFDWLLDHHAVDGSQARLRICLMLNRLLKLLGDDAEIDDELYQKIFDNMLERLKDKVAEIRAQAVTALQRLQDPKDEACPIVRAFIFHLGCDPSPIVRRTIIKCIGATRLTLPHIIRRTLDTDERVRRFAYKFIADKIHIKSLTIAQREEIIKRGLTDRNENVKKMVSKELLPSWLRLCNDRIVELLYALDVGNSDGETAKEIFNVLFEDMQHKEIVDNFCYLDPATKLVPSEKLSPETAVYWRNLTRYMYDEIEERGVVAATPYLEQLLPELSQFCQYIRIFILNHNQGKNAASQDTDDASLTQDEDDEEAKEVAWFFVAKQLVEMTSVFDLSDEMGRNNLAKLCREILLSRKVTTDFVDPVMRIFTVVQNSPSSRIQEIAEIIAELREPLLLRDADKQKDNDEVMGDGNHDERLVDQTLQLEFDAMENANKVLSKAEQVRHEEAIRKKQVEMAKVRVQLNIMKHDLEEAIQNQDFVRAQQIKVDMDKLEQEVIHLQEELTEAAAMAPVPFSEARKDRINDNRQDNLDPGEVVDGQELNQSAVRLDDPLIIHKSLKMLGVMLESNDIKSANATLQTLLDEFVIPSIQNVDCHIRNSAVKAMGGCCLRSLDAAKRHLLLILQIAHLDTPEVRITALNVIYDLLMWHGLPAFITNMNEDINSKDDANVSDMSNTSQDNELATLESALDSVQGCRLPTQKQFETHGGNSVVAILSQLLDDPDIDIRTRVAEGLCKLLMCGSISSPKLFSRLILMWYNPITETDGKLRHILGTFFPLYASFSRANQDSIEESFMPTLKTLFDAPATSPLMEVDVDDVGMFYLSLTAAAMLQQPKTMGTGVEANRDDEENGDIASEISVSVHDAMAYTLCNQIIASPDSFHVKTLIKLLLNLQITANNFVKIRELKLFHTHMMQAVRDKLSLKALDRFGMRLDEWLMNDQDRDKEKDEENSTLEANPTEDQDKEAEVNSEDDQSANAAAMKKKRTLFTHDTTTLLDLTKAVELESSADSEKTEEVIQSSPQINHDASHSPKPSSPSSKTQEAIQGSPHANHDASHSAGPSSPSSMFSTASDDTEEQNTTLRPVENSPIQTKRAKRDLVGDGSAQSIISLTPSTPAKLVTRAVATLNEHEEASETEESDNDIPNPKSMVNRKGKKELKETKTFNERTVIDETESEEEDENKASSRPSRNGLRNTQSTSSMQSTLSTSGSRTRSRSTQNTSLNNSELCESPQTPFKGSLLELSLLNTDRVTRSSSRSSINSLTKRPGRGRK